MNNLRVLRLPQQLRARVQQSTQGCFTFQGKIKNKHQAKQSTVPRSQSRCPQHPAPLETPLRIQASGFHLSLLQVPQPSCRSPGHLTVAVNTLHAQFGQVIKCLTSLGTSTGARSPSMAVASRDGLSHQFRSRMTCLNVLCLH